MEQNDEPIKLTDSINIIEQFMLKTRDNLARKSFVLLFWGFIIAGCTLGEFVLIRWVGYSRHYLIWPVLTILGTLFTIVYKVRLEKNSIESFSDMFLNYLFGGSAIVYFTVAFLCVYNKVPPLPYMMVISGFLLFVTGGVTQFKPLFFGAAIFEGSAISSIFVDYPSQLLISFGALFLGYIIPGYLLKSKK